MSQRGLILALQRFHDDPGFADRVAQDPQGTLGLYDLDENERQQLMKMDEAEMNRLASSLGLDLGGDHVSGVGALDDEEVQIESQGKPGINVPHVQPGDGYDGAQPR